MHGVRYTKFIGDGDSSVHPTLLQNVPGWGYAIQKLECANHACKCYRGALEQLVQSNPSYKGSGGLTSKVRKKLVSAARCAIRMRSQEVDRTKALASLRKDLVNGPLHVFGIHTHCSTDFCTVQQQQQQQQRQQQQQSQQHPSTSSTTGHSDGEETHVSSGAGSNSDESGEEEEENQEGVDNDEGKFFSTCIDKDYILQ